MSAESEADERKAALRYFLMNAVRIGSLGAVILGIMIVRSIAAGPYWLGAGLALAGMIAFFFAPPLLAKRWKAGDRALSSDQDSS